MSATLGVKVVPRASRTELAGWHGDRLRVRIAAVPENGRANAILIGFLASVLGVPRRDVRLRAGRAATLKLVEIDGIDAATLAARLPPQPGE